MKTGIRYKGVLFQSAAVALAGMLSLSGAQAASYTEGPDLPNGSSFFPGVATLGNLSTGANTVTGGLTASCVGVSPTIDCNPSNAVDGQDSILFTIPVGFLLTGINLNYSMISGPAGFLASLNIRDPSVNVFNEFFISPGTPYSATTAIGPGTYSASFYGQRANSAGSYQLSYSYSLNVVAATSPVPEPATWAMMMLGFGALGTALRRRPASKARVRFA